MARRPRTGAAERLPYRAGQDERAMHGRQVEFQASHELLQATMDASTDMIQVFEAIRDATGRIVDFRWVLNNHTSERKYGEVRGESLLQRNPGVIEEGIFDAFCRVTETGLPEQAEHHYVHEQFDGWFFQIVVKLGDGVATTTRDITEWKESQAEIVRLREEVVKVKLAETEGQLAAIFATAPVGMSVLSLDGSFLRVNEELCRILGRPREEVLALSVPDVTHPDDLQPSLVAIEEALSTGRPRTLDKRYARPDGSLVWASSTLSVLPRSDGQPDRLLVVTADLSERRKADEALRRSEALQRVLIAELQHRTSNLLGVVRSIAENTARGAGTLAEFRTHFDDRLDALSRVQALLSRLSEHDRVTFDSLLHAELVAMDGRTDAVTLEGPPGVRLRSSTVHTLAMAIHELATNAIKYGALGQDGGRLAINWTLEAEGADGKPWLHIDWRESGVSMPPEREWPKGTGQGRELIERALPYQLGARTTYRLGADGVHCTIAIPVSATIGADEGGAV
ncbi:PAS domain S-box protein [Sphingomonas sanguinis]|uniref:histidine kinase n=1 Tax=Sphingomonas sanguinis TaxID=33051 RepID=A0ABU5LQ61_9SPHN|nr:PAS domain S-box protein [Sphingomonas sanguinis]MDZ7281861.1 PAS domain S-box protein [Sphingomonas sanguinis]